jgi:hypothetical protein
MELLTVFVINGLVVALAVVIHYETLYQLARHLPRVRVPPRYKVLWGVFLILVAHVAEIWLFALTYWGLLQVDGMGVLSGNVSGGGTLLDCSYFSFVTFTTVGYGDIVATGPVRCLTGMEALTGFVLITWSASFLFLEMQKYWPGLASARGHREDPSPRHDAQATGRHGL